MGTETRTDQDVDKDRRYFAYGYSRFLEQIDKLHPVDNSKVKGQPFPGWQQYQRAQWARYRHQHAMETLETNVAAFRDIWAGYVTKNKLPRGEKPNEAYKKALRAYIQDRSLTDQQLIEDQSSWEELPPLRARDDGDTRCTALSLIRWYEKIVPAVPDPDYIENVDYIHSLLEPIEQHLIKPNWATGKTQTNRNFLLVSKSGRGKNLLVQFVANKSGLPVMHFSYGDYATKMVGESEANVRSFVQATVLFAPLIVNMDECDTILDENSSTGENTKQSQSYLQTHLSGDQITTPGLFVLCATNYLGRLKEAMLSRFANQILVKKPPDAKLLAQIYTQLKEAGYLKVCENSTVIDDIYRKLSMDDPRKVKAFWGGVCQCLDIEIRKLKKHTTEQKDFATRMGELSTIGHANSALQLHFERFKKSTDGIEQLKNTETDEQDAVANYFEVDREEPAVQGVVYITCRNPDIMCDSFIIDNIRVSLEERLSETDMRNRARITKPYQFTPVLVHDSFYLALLNEWKLSPEKTAVYMMRWIRDNLEEHRARTDGTHSCHRFESHVNIHDTNVVGLVLKEAEILQLENVHDDQPELDVESFDDTAVSNKRDRSQTVSPHAVQRPCRRFRYEDVMDHGSPVPTSCLALATTVPTTSSNEGPTMSSSNESNINSSTTLSPPAAPTTDGNIALTPPTALTTSSNKASASNSNLQHLQNIDQITLMTITPPIPYYFVLPSDDICPRPNGASMTDCALYMVYNCIGFTVSEVRERLSFNEKTWNADSGCLLRLMSINTTRNMTSCNSGNEQRLWYADCTIDGCCELNWKVGATGCRCKQSD